jgi:hypothetical protein
MPSKPAAAARSARMVKLPRRAPALGAVGRRQKRILTAEAAVHKHTGWPTARRAMTGALPDSQPREDPLITAHGPP